MALRIEYDTERVVRLGCFVFRAEPSKSPQERQVAQLIEGSAGDLSKAVSTIERTAEAIADAMEVLHGVPFRADVHHDRRMVLIHPDFSSRSR